MLYLPQSRVAAPRLEDVANYFKYQPFKLADGRMTGVAAHLTAGSDLRIVDPKVNSTEEVAQFAEANGKLAAMYEYFIDETVKALGGSVAGMTYLDTACNAGYFCYRFAQLGAARSVGVDVLDMQPAFDFANAAIGTNAEYIRAPYNWQTHEFSDGAGDFDIVSNIAFMCHCSDPQFLLASLAKRTKKALLLFSRIPPANPDEYFIRFHPATKKYFGQNFPICFDASTEISEPLVTFGLEDLGFKVAKIPLRPDIWTLSPANSWQAFIAVR